MLHKMFIPVRRSMQQGCNPHKNHGTIIGMNKIPPKRAIAVWVLGILIGIAYTLNAYHFSHNNVVGVLIGIALTVVWIIWVILVWHQEIVERWLRIRGKNHEAN